MIRSFHLNGLNGNRDFGMQFHPDLNVITGRNGSGKTTVIKAAWYLLSGNFLRLVEEVRFRSASLVTDTITLEAEVHRDDRTPWPSLKVIATSANGESSTFSVSRGLPLEGRRNRHTARFTGASFFFPTFRRIEGGFAVAPAHGRYRATGPDSTLDEALDEVSTNLSAASHSFVASISTSDVVDLFTKRLADSSDEINRKSRDTTSEVSRLITNYKASRKSEDPLRAATDVLEEVQRLIEAYSTAREVSLKPFDTLSTLVDKVFRDKGVQITPAITLGTHQNAVDSTALSAGEKQMLSFLAYNVFSRDTVFMIDEPELSLHADWQRMLFPVLLTQGTGNQFVVATHSPFIYAKYPDKELHLMDGEAP